MNNEQNNNFSYTYSSREQQELKKIRDKYAPQKEDKLQRLRRLDASVTKKGRACSIIQGVFGTLIMGIGMSACMVGPSELFMPGIAVGMAGIVLIALAYPVYAAIVKRERRKIAPEIIRLTDELMK